MAADERKIVIELKTTNTANNNKKSSHDYSDSDRRESIKDAVSDIGDRAIREVASVTHFYVDRYLTLSEDYKNAVRLENFSATVDRVRSMRNTVSSAITLGSSIGGFAGASLGTISVFVAGLSSIINLQLQHNQQGLSLAMADKSSGYARSRLGLIDNGRGTEN